MKGDVNYILFICSYVYWSAKLYFSSIKFIKKPCLLVFDSIASSCNDVVSVHCLNVKKRACDHILWIASLHLCGDGLLIATLSLTLFLSPRGKIEKS